METITYSNFRQNLRSIINKVCDDADRVVVTTNDNRNVVVISQDEYNSLAETLYLLRSPANRERLFRGIEQANEGKGIERELADI
jgi:antitoxin YefM